MGTERFAEILAEPGFWPEGGPVEVHETHISRIFLVGDRAYKLKKPVDFGFVDFSSLEKRKFFCEEEIRLNRRLAPELYLGLRRVTGSVENPEFEGSGQTIEYAIELLRFDQESLLGNLEEAGELRKEHLEQLAKIVADFHQRAPVAGAETDFGTPEEIAQPAEENFTQILAQSPSSNHESTLRKLLLWTQEKQKELQELFIRRRSDNRIRECHGDLHLGNILFHEGKIVLFDCIEFSEKLRWIDVLNDIGFCGMDLASRGRADFSHHLLNLYLEQTGDYEGAPLLPYYLSYRAMVRAKVAWLQIGGAEGESRKTFETEFEKYLSLAERYTRNRIPKLILMHGLSGSGKSFGGEKLVQALGAIRIRSDVERKRLAAEWDAGSLYTEEMTAKTYARLHTAAASCLQAGFPVVLDATYLRRHEREQAFALANDLGVQLQILDITATEGTLRRRITERQRHRSDPSDADLQVLDLQMETREPLTDFERTRALTVDTEKPDCWANIVNRLKQDQAD